MATNIGPRIGIDGEAKYHEQIRKLIQSTKTLKSEMQALETQTTKSKNPFVQLGNEMTKNAEKRRILSDSISEQQNKIQKLNQHLEEMKNKGATSATEILKQEESINKATTALNKMNAELENTPTKLQTVGNAMQSAGDKIAGVGSTLTTHVTAPLVGLGALSLKEFSDWESAFTGVMKTVDETATTSYADIEEAIKKMATETASSKEEIAGVAEVAGQLGVGADDIEKFTKTMVMLGDSTNLSSDQAATSLARIINITGESTGNIDRLGASVVALGNNFATDETSIVEMSNRLAAAGTIAGLSTQDILGIATAMSSVGIQAEAGGTAMTQTLTGISKAVSEGGDKLEQLASVSGMRAEEFSNAWNTSPVEALQAFIGGLSQMNEAELDTYKVLDELGMSGIRQSNMLQSLALASDTLTSAVNTSNAAYEQNTALVDEASKRYETFDAKMSQTKEKLSNVGVELGERLLPYVDKVLDGVDGLVQAWDNLSPGAQDAVVKIGLIAAATGPLLVGIGKVTSAAGAVITNTPIILGALGSVGTFLTGTLAPAVGSFIAAAAPIITPFLPFIAIAAGVVGAGVLIYQNWDTIKEKAGELKETVTTKVSEIREGVSQKWEELKQDTTEKWDGIKQKIDENGGGIQGVLVTYGEFYKQSWQSTFNAIDQTTGGKLSSIVSKVQTKLGEIKQNVDSNGGGIQGILATYGEFYQSTWESTFEAINRATGGKLGEAVNTVSTKVGEIRNFFTNIAGEASKWGTDLIGNFISGITSKLSDLLSTVSNVANKVASYIHFSEPDVGPLKDFHTFAPDMMKLYAQGIESNIGMVEDAMATVSGTVARNMEQKTYSSSVGAVNIVINAHEGQSVEDLADIVQERINREVMLSARSMA